MDSSLLHPGSHSGWLVVGLGNPGRKYAGTRHNIGFRVIDRFAEEEAIPLDRLKFQAQMGQGRYGKVPLILGKPMTFMNLSGESVYSLTAYNNIDIHRLIVLHDDVDFLLGTLRIKTGGGAGGHKGIQSIINRLGESDFIRVRIGVGRPQNGDMADYVLSRFDREEKDQVEEVVMKTLDIIRSILEVGVEETMNRFHNPNNSGDI
jgi:PTH1 family peptidyl-tRNA hydrolase